MSAKVLKLEFADDSQRKANAFIGLEPLIRNVRRMAKVASDCVHDNDRASKGTTDPSEMAIWSVFQLEEMIEDLEKRYDEAWARQ